MSKGRYHGFRRAVLLLAVSGATLFQTTSCSVDDLLASLGLSTVLSALFSSSTT